MWGNPNHLAEMNRVFQDTRCREDSERGPDGEEMRVLVPETNKDSGTYDGIDWGGERVAEEVSVQYLGVCVTLVGLCVCYRFWTR